MTQQAPALPRADSPMSSVRMFVDDTWDTEIVPMVSRFIEIPAKSPMFDPDWERNGFLERVVQDAADWVLSRKVAGLKLEIVRLPGRTPLLFFEVPATAPGGNDAHADTICLYGHLDKQPEFTGWRSNLGPWTPKYIDGLLYGRGGADDGYAVYAAITAIMALDREGIARPRCVGLIEACEESGSLDLPAYIDALKARLGNVGLVVCLDGNAGNYDQLWLTTSLRGMVTGNLQVDILTEGVHSGEASGIAASSFRILRHVLERLEDSRTGELLPQCFHCEIPTDRMDESRAAAKILGDAVWKQLPWACGADGALALPVTGDPLQGLLNRTWKPALSVTGASGLPSLQDAGNVLRPFTAFKLSLRLPPLVDGNEAAAKLKALLEDNAPYGAKVVFTPDARAGGDIGTTGWNAPSIAPDFARALDEASRAHFGAPCAHLSQGGTIPLMAVLQQQFPSAQMMVCGLVGPKSNAHGPNEFLHVPYGKKLTAAVAQVMSTYGGPSSKPALQLIHLNESTAA